MSARDAVLIGMRVDIPPPWSTQQRADAILSALRAAGYAVVPRELPDGIAVNVSDMTPDGLWAAFLAALDDYNAR